MWSTVALLAPVLGQSMNSLKPAYEATLHFWMLGGQNRHQCLVEPGEKSDADRQEKITNLINITTEVL